VARADDLAKLPIEPQELHDVFYKMIKGADGVISYPSLLRYVVLNQGERRLSVFLARPPLLLAIYQDPHTVGEIIQKRTELQLAVENESIAAETATTEFQEAFAQPSLLTVDPKYLDFRVTKTEPHNAP